MIVICNIIQPGIPENVAMKISGHKRIRIGHSTIQLTERYSHLRPGGLKTATKNFDNNLNRKNIASMEEKKNIQKGGQVK